MNDFAAQLQTNTVANLFSQHDVILLNGRSDMREFGRQVAAYLQL